MISRDSFQRLYEPRTQSITPLPIETAYFLSDAAKFTYNETDEKTGKIVVKEKLIRDKTKFNRFYFNYPPEWKTSNVGEMIVGVRSLWTLNKRRTLTFDIFLRKYKKYDFYLKAIEIFPNDYKDMDIGDFTEAYIDDERIQEIINKMDKDKIIVQCFRIKSWLPVESDLREVFSDIDACLKGQTDFKNLLKYYASQTEDNVERLKYYQYIDQFTEEELICKSKYSFWFKQNDRNSYISTSDRDVQMDGYYENGIFNEVIYSARNEDPYIDGFYVDIMLTNPQSTNTYLKRYKSKSDPDASSSSTLNATPIDDLFPSSFNPYSRSDPQPLDDSDKFDDDFNIVFNIGDEPWQNSLDYITRFHRKIVLKNVYDRRSVKVHASFANQSNDFYVGNSQVYFNPIKYYKLNTNDDKFWLEFYSGRHPDCPVNIPEDEGFVLEMIFMQNQKLLYI